MEADSITTDGIADLFASHHRQPELASPARRQLWRVPAISVAFAWIV